jgi:hypothetical protein
MNQQDSNQTEPRSWRNAEKRNKRITMQGMTESRSRKKRGDAVTTRDQSGTKSRARPSLAPTPIPTTLPSSRILRHGPTHPHHHAPVRARFAEHVARGARSHWRLGPAAEQPRLPPPAQRARRAHHTRTRATPRKRATERTAGFLLPAPRGHARPRICPARRDPLRCYRARAQGERACPRARQATSQGCDVVLGVCSVGALHADMPPGTLVVPDDFFCPHDVRRGKAAPFRAKPQSTPTTARTSCRVRDGPARRRRSRHTRTRRRRRGQRQR